MSIAVLEYWSKLVPPLWLARSRTIAWALVGIAGEALRSTARVELVGTAISALERERSGNSAWELAGTADEVSGIRVTESERRTFGNKL